MTTRKHLEQIFTLTGRDSAADAIGNARFEFFGRFLSGLQAPRPRWKRGVALVNVALGDAVGRLYVDEHLPRSARSRVERIAERITPGYREAVSGFDWPTTNARSEAQSQIACVAIRVGYPDVWRDYRGLVIDRDHLPGNMMRFHKFDADGRRSLGAIGAVIGYEIGRALDSGRRIPAGLTVEAFNDLAGLLVAFRATDRRGTAGPTPSSTDCPPTSVS